MVDHKVSANVRALERWLIDGAQLICLLRERPAAQQQQQQHSYVTLHSFRPSVIMIIMHTAENFPPSPECALPNSQQRVRSLSSAQRRLAVMFIILPAFEIICAAHGRA